MSWCHILLITPPSPFLLDERVFLSLGILKIAAVLLERGVSVEHLDLSGVENYLDLLSSRLDGLQVSHVGITSTTPQLPAVVKIIAKIRAVNPSIRIILGGPHVTLTVSAAKVEKRAGRVSRSSEALARLLRISDVLVSGDGERAIFEAIQNDRAKLIDADELVSPFYLSSSAYSTSPYPARQLADLESYHYEIDGRRSTSLIAQLGCPFGCGFCGGRSSKTFRVVRQRSIESIVGELRLLHREFGFNGFMFYDDELNIGRNLIPFMNALCDLQNEVGVEFRFRGFIKAELFTEAQARSMFQAGFRWILSGFESGSPRLLKNMNKGATVDDNSRVLEISRRVGLKVKALMSLGHPGESDETVGDTESWLLRSAPDDFDCTIITTYPGTPYFDDAIETGENVWTYTCRSTGDRLHAFGIDFFSVMDHYKGIPNGGYRSYVYTDYLNSEQLVAHRDNLEANVRRKLELEYPKQKVPIRYEHSMGQGLGLR